MGRLAAYAAILACALGGAATTVAQPDLEGDWRSIRHEDLPDRGPGVGLGDYAGIPLTDAARQFAESWDASGSACRSSSAACTCRRTAIAAR